jgi:hypothetical protein
MHGEAFGALSPTAASNAGLDAAVSARPEIGRTTRMPRHRDGVSLRVRTNALAALWMLVLTLIGCYLLGALADNVRREECRLASPGACETFKTRLSVIKPNAEASQSGKLGAYLKRSRRWR